MKDIFILVIPIVDIFLFIYLLILIKKKARNYLKTFAFISLFFSVGWLIIFNIETFYNSIFLTVIDYFIPPIIAYSFVQFFIVFLKEKKLNKWKNIYLLIPIIFVELIVGFLLINIQNGIMLSYNNIYYGIYVGILIIYFFIIPTYLFTKKYNELNRIKKNQLLIIMIGYYFPIIPAIFACIYEGFIDRDPYKINFLNILLINFTIILPISYTYAITRYRFMDIKVLIKKSMVYLLVLFVVLAVCLGIIIGLYFGLKNYLEINEQIAVIICVSLLVIILPALQKHLKKQIDKYIKSEFVDLSVQDREFTDSLNQAHQLDDLIFKVAAFIKSKINPKAIYFLVRDIRTPELKYVCQYPKDKNINFLEDLALINKIFQNNNKVLVKEELQYLKPDIDANKKILKKTQVFFEANSAQIMIPLKKNDVIHGYITLSAKENNTMYNEEELNLLSQLSEQVSLALDRVLFYEETMERVRREFGR